MFSTRNDDYLDFEAELMSTGPVRQRRAVRVNGTKRSRSVSRRKIKSNADKTGKVGGIHQRSNKRINW